MNSLILSNITHRPARSIVSVFGISISMLLILFTVGLSHGLLREHGRSEANMGAEIMVRASGTMGLAGNEQFRLPTSRAEEIARIEGVRATTPIGQNNISSELGFGLRLVDGIEFDSYSTVSGMKILAGRRLEGPDDVIVDQSWQTAHKVQLGSIIKLYDRPFTIVGIFGPAGGASTKILLSTMQEQLASHEHCTSVLVACVDPAEMQTVAARIHEKFPDDQLIFTRDLPELYTAGVPSLQVFTKVVVSVALAISLLIILLAMYTAVSERTRQIGVLKALGMSKPAIAWIIEKEVIVIVLAGVVMGVVMTFAAGSAISRFSGLIVEIEWRWILIAVITGLVAATLGALYPALRAANRDAVEALNFE